MDIVNKNRGEAQIDFVQKDYQLLSKKRKEHNIKNREIQNFTTLILVKKFCTVMNRYKNSIIKSEIVSRKIYFY